MPRPFDGGRQFALVERATARDTAGQNFTAFGEALPVSEPRHVLVVDERGSVGAKLANLFSGALDGAPAPIVKISSFSHLNSP
jgi:hypothetical protein